MNVIQTQQDVEKLIDTLAVVGCTSYEFLRNATGLTAEKIRELDLPSQPGVVPNGEELSLEADLAQERLGYLEQHDKDRFQRLHDDALTYLASQPSIDEPTVGPILLRVFRRLADHLLAERSGGFDTLLAASERWDSQSTSLHQWRTYYIGVHQLEEDAFDQALSSFDELLAQGTLDDELLGRVLNSQANVFRVKGRHEDALNGYRASLQIWDALGDEVNAGKALLNMGALAYYLQNYADAEPWLSQAVALFRSQKMAVLQGAAENGLGLVYRDQGRWVEAIEHFQRFIDESRSRGSADSVGIGLLNVGEVLLFQGKLEEAIHTLTEALAQMERRLFLVDVHLHLGLAYWAQEQIDPAHRAFVDAAQIADELDRKEVIPHVAYWQGVVAEAQGDVEAAESHFHHAIAVIEESRDPLTNEELKISLLGRWQQIYEALILLYVRTDRPEEAFHWAERARARAFAELLANGQSSVDSRKAEPSIELNELQQNLPAQSCVLCYFTTGVLASDIPMLGAIPRDNPLRKRLLIDAQTLCIVITQDDFGITQCPIDPNLFTMVSPRGYDTDRWLEPTVLAHLSQSLLPPNAVLAQVDRLYVIPHGPLHLVPFAALLGQDGAKNLMGKRIIIAPNAAVLQRSLRSKQQGQDQGQDQRQEQQSLMASMNSLAVGFNGEVQGRSLRYTEAEVSSVAALLHGQAIVGTEAKKEHLRTLVQEMDWLHFACHGWFNHEDPLSSYLETGSGERLSAREVLEDWSLEAELVTLSACQTGVSRVLRGDEPMGLVRGFLAAGAKAVLVTRWPVADLPTCLLMLRFYQLLIENRFNEPSWALYAAQRWLQELGTSDAIAFLGEFGIESTEDDIRHDEDSDKPPFAHPQYWAAFSLVIGG